MINSVGLREEVDRAPAGRHGIDVSSLRAAFYAALVTALAAVQAAGEEPVAAPKHDRAATTASKTRLPDELARFVAQMDDDEFAERQEGMKELENRLWDAFERDNVDPLVENLARTPWGTVRKLSAEQRLRIRHLTKMAADWKQLPHAYPLQGAIDGVEALRMTRERIKAPIAMEAGAARKIGGMRFELDGTREERSSTGIFARMLGTAGVKPEEQPNGDITLVPLHEREKILWSQDLIGVMRRTEDGFPESITLHPGAEPGRIMAIADGNGVYSDYGGCMGPCCRPQMEEKGAPDARQVILRVDPSPRVNEADDWNTLYREMAPYNETHVQVVVALGQAKAELRAGGDRQKIGGQALEMSVPEPREGGGWTFKLTGTIFGHVAWPDTPVEWDDLSYKFLSEGNRYIVRSADGAEIPANVQSTTFNMRSVDITLSCPEKPERVDVTAYDTMDMQWRQLPHKTVKRTEPPAPRPARP